MDPVYRLDIQVLPAVVDENGHVNNVTYVQWMQEAAIRHATATGCTQMTSALGATWVARTHHVEYLRPAFAGDTVTVLTWVANFHKVRSLRKYKFLRAGDATVLVQAETDWVFVEAATGRPVAIPASIKNTFQLVSPEQEP